MKENWKDDIKLWLKFVMADSLMIFYMGYTCEDIFRQMDIIDC